MKVCLLLTENLNCQNLNTPRFVVQNVDAEIIGRKKITIVNPQTLILCVCMSDRCCGLFYLRWLKGLAVVAESER